MKAIWSGAISFGLVNIPIKLYSATEERRVNLSQLDSSDHQRIRYKRVNEKTGKEVDYENIVKGYEMDGTYVVLSDDDMDEIAAKKSKTIDIEEFVEVDQISDLLYKKPYFVEPTKDGQKAYALLLSALKKTKKVGVATFVMRSKEHLTLVSHQEDVIVLHVIRFQDELRDAKSLDLPDGKEVKKKEVDMAVSLIENYSTDFDLSRYKDVYNEQLMKIIEAKAKGKKPKIAKMKVIPTNDKDLAAQLEASLKKVKKAS